MSEVRNRRYGVLRRQASVSLASSFANRINCARGIGEPWYYDWHAQHAYTSSPRSWRMRLTSDRMSVITSW